MPRFSLNTFVEKDFQDVFSKFDRDLFNYLLPPSFLVKVNRYDGNQKGDEVHVEFKFPFKASMNVVITDVIMEPDHAYFVDQGLQLPFGMKEWKHTHHVFREPKGSRICDEVHFSCNFRILYLLYFPLLWFSMKLRNRPYQKYFKKS